MIRPCQTLYRLPATLTGPLSDRPVLGLVVPPPLPPVTSWLALSHPSDLRFKSLPPGPFPGHLSSRSPLSFSPGHATRPPYSLRRPCADFPGRGADCPLPPCGIRSMGQDGESPDLPAALLVARCWVNRGFADALTEHVGKRMTGNTERRAGPGLWSQTDTV